MTATVEQCRARLKTANTVRSERADFRRRVKAGEASVSALIRRPKWWAETWATGEVLLMGRGVGPYRLGRLLRDIGASERCPLGELSRRQRRRLSWLIHDDACSADDLDWYFVSSDGAA